MSTRPRHVVFAHPENGYPHDREMGAEHLTVGAVYTVESAHMEAWHTTYRLSEVPGKAFNSVLFETYTNAERMEDVESGHPMGDGRATCLDEGD